MRIVDSIVQESHWDYPPSLSRGRPVSQRPLRMRRTDFLIVVIAAINSPSCNSDAPQQLPNLLPDLHLARQAMKSSLEEWRTSPETDTTVPGRSVIFVDRQRQLGQKLREFAILGESEVDNRRRFVTRLSLAHPDESTLAAYFVFGKDPIWVYRSEDFDMMMNMDMAPDIPFSGVGSPRTEGSVESQDAPTRRRAPLTRRVMSSIAHAR